MNPGPVSDTATLAINALKASPLMLTLVLLQVLTLGAILYSSIHRQNAISVQMDALTEIIKSCVSGKPTP